MSDTRSRLSPELSAVADFLRQAPPFDQLDEDTLLTTAARMAIAYHTTGETFVADTEPVGLRMVRSGAVDIQDNEKVLLDRLGEGESFHIGGLNAERGEVHATVIEDALIYLLPDEHYQALRSADRNFDRHFSTQRNRRLRRAARYEPDPNTMMMPVHEVMSGSLLVVHAGETAQSVAEKMSQRRVSSAFVLENDKLVGIVTDRDFRQRLVARGLSADTLIRELMTPDPLTIEGDATLFETTLLMTRHKIHHIPVMQSGELAGIVTTSDLMLSKQDDPVYLVQHISRQPDVAGIASLLEGMSNLLVQWVNAGARAAQISRILTAISDAVASRLIQLAEAELGPAPASWCWLGFGSQARAEQLLGADQDNGIIIDDSCAAGDIDWYAQLARRVCDGLNQCGYVYCPGNVMAVNDAWRQPLAAWQDTVNRWTQSPTPDAVMRVSIFFDLRVIYGDTSLGARLQETMLREAGRNTIFQAALAANALDVKAPLGIFRRFVVDRNGEHASELDLKKRGILPITEIIRLHALAGGVSAVNTAERLDALVKVNNLTLADARNLADALNYIAQVRVKHQAAQIRAGESVTNFINPRDLPKMAREQLRDAFTIIDEAQTTVRLRYRAGL